MWRLVFIIFILSLTNIQCKKNKGEDVNINNYCGNFRTESYNHKLNPGCSAKDFLISKIYKSLKIEIQYMPGQQPEAGVITLIQNFLHERLNKPNGIIIELKEIFPTSLTNYSLSDLNNIENKNRTAYTKGEQLTAYILIVDGCYYSSNA